MIVTAWRIVKGKNAASAFTGQGARLAGGRWNSPGVAVIYVAGSASLAMLEMLVHLQGQELLSRYVLFEVTFDRKLVADVKVKDLPRSWRKSPPPGAAQHIGDAWVAGGRSAVLRVPSVIVPTEANYLLNPSHPDFARIAIGLQQAMKFDRRLGGGGGQ